MIAEGGVGWGALNEMRCLVGAYPTGALFLPLVSIKYCRYYVTSAKFH